MIRLNKHRKTDLIGQLINDLQTSFYHPLPCKRIIHTMREAFLHFFVDREIQYYNALYSN